jgi:hypothetical protein
MGTSGSYGGSKGTQWRRTRTAARELANGPIGSEGAIATLLYDLAIAAGFNDQGEIEEDPQPGYLTRPSVIAFGHPTTIASSGLAGLGLGGAPYRTGIHRGGGSASRSAGRSVTRTARSAARALGAGYGLRFGETSALSSLGLDLAELQSLDPIRQSMRILQALDLSSAIADEELRLALADVLLAVQSAPIAPSPPDLVRLFVVSYVTQVLITEAGENWRASGARSAADLERQVRDYLSVRVEQRTVLDLPNNGRQLDTHVVETAIASLLRDITKIVRS